MPRLDSSKGRYRRRSELSVTAARARKVRAIPLETKARSKGKGTGLQEQCTRAMTETWPRVLFTLLEVGPHTRRLSDSTGSTDRMVQWLVFKNLNLKLTVFRQHNGAMPTVMARNWIRGVGVLQR